METLNLWRVTFTDGYEMDMTAPRLAQWFTAKVDAGEEKSVARIEALGVVRCDCLPHLNHKTTCSAYARIWRGQVKNNH